MTQRVELDPKLDALVERHWFTPFMHDALAAMKSNVRYMTFPQLVDFGTSLVESKAVVHAMLDRVDADPDDYDEDEQHELVARELYGRRAITTVADEVRRRRLSLN